MKLGPLQPLNAQRKGFSTGETSTRDRSYGRIVTAGPHSAAVPGRTVPGACAPSQDSRAAAWALVYRPFARPLNRASQPAPCARRTCEGGLTIVHACFPDGTTSTHTRAATRTPGRPCFAKHVLKVMCTHGMDFNSKTRPAEATHLPPCQAARALTMTAPRLRVAGSRMAWREGEGRGGREKQE